MAAEILRRLARSFRRSVEEGRTRHACGPFDAFLSEATDDYLMSVAAPVAEEADWDAALPALDRLFEIHGRRLRLEYFAELHPGLLPALERIGAQAEMRAPVMALPAERWRSRPVAARLLAAEDLAGIEAMEEVQWAAYGADITREVQAAFRPLMIEGLRSGAIIASLVEAEGRPVAAALVMDGGEAAELAGVATIPEARGRGHAETACRAVLDAYFASGGGLAWLSAGPMAGGLYARIGFETVGEQLNVGRGRA